MESEELATDKLNWPVAVEVAVGEGEAVTVGEVVGEVVAVGEAVAVEVAVGDDEAVTVGDAVRVGDGVAVVNPLLPPPQPGSNNPNGRSKPIPARRERVFIVVLTITADFITGVPDVSIRHALVFFAF